MMEGTWYHPQEVSLDDDEATTENSYAASYLSLHCMHEWPFYLVSWLIVCVLMMDTVEFCWRRPGGEDTALTSPARLQQTDGGRPRAGAVQCSGHSPIPFQAFSWSLVSRLPREQNIIPGPKHR